MNVYVAANVAVFNAAYAEYIPHSNTPNASRWRIADASTEGRYDGREAGENDDAVASCAAAEEGYARLIVQALNEHFERRGKP